MRRADSLKRPWCWERLRAGGEGDNRGWVGWMASRTQWTWVWVNSGSYWWTGRPGVLRFMGLQRVGHDWATELKWKLKKLKLQKRMLCPNYQLKRNGVTINLDILSYCNRQPQCPSVSPTPSIHMYACVLSRFCCVQLFWTLWTVAHQVPLSMEFSRQEYWSGLPCSPPCDLPDSGLEPMFPTAPAMQVGSLLMSHLGSPLAFTLLFNSCLFWMWIGFNDSLLMNLM